MEENEKSLQLELIKTKIEVNNEDARAILLYGTISLGVLALLLPFFNVSAPPHLYWLGLFVGTLLISCGAFAVIFFSREQIAWSNRLYGVFFDDVASDKIPSNSSIIKEFKNKKESVGTFKAYEILFKFAKLTLAVGVVIYVFLFSYGLLRSYCSGQSFFM